MIVLDEIIDEFVDFCHCQILAQKERFLLRTVLVAESAGARLHIHHSKKTTEILHFLNDFTERRL